ncbi:leucine-rich repeat-containing protein kinase family protein [Aquirhabdus sp.]|uniref:leucine-rich repeat-containing protein kinase family protein n=1 Tax=Aquirhabdus sp. TaxID=2824160 RepID=UPI00396C8744
MPTINTLEELRSRNIQNCRRINLSCGLTAFPSEIFEYAETLEVLNLTGNALTSLPDDLYRLKKLKILFCSNNLFKTLPRVLGQCQSLSMIGFKSNQIQHVPAEALPSDLRWLILTDNQIEEIPESIGKCSKMQKLMLAGNRLTHLPDTLAACQNLQLLRISSNQLTALPNWLLTLPRLAWLAYAGNPCAELKSDFASIRDIAWHDLHIQHLLGEGASGHIYQARLSDPSSHEPLEVAVKIFKGQLTSDGLPQNEMAASIAVGQHANLICALGRITGHPDSALGLVMPLIDPLFKNLAGPPSLESCTRDVYSADDRFSILNMLDLGYGIASAMTHLHAQGILHGDLYAHNILYNAHALDHHNCLLGDFGGATFFTAMETQAQDSLQRIEVLAFAYLLEELLQRCETSDISILAELWELQRCCADHNVATRPLFNEITAKIESIRIKYSLRGKH